MRDSLGDYRHTIVYDLDGTLLTNAWPDLGDWQRDAIDVVRYYLDQGVSGTVFSARLSPYDPFTMQERDPGVVLAETYRVRNMLDRAGLQDLDIWTLPGKPGASVYVDDRAIWYPGRPGSWKRMVPKINRRLKMEDPKLPVFTHRDLG